MNCDKAREIVHDWVKENVEDLPSTFSMSDVYCVWWSKTLQNSKCMVGTTLPDDMYYELTYNGEKGEIYFDAYRKTVNLIISAQVQKAPAIPTGPHSNKCRIGPHRHGSRCHVSCPTCHGLNRI